MERTSTRLPPPLAKYRNIAAAGLLSALIARLYWHGVVAAFAPTDDAVLEVIELDPRTVSWRELSLIPGIGDEIAKKLVVVVRRFPAEPDRWIGVRGVGPVTLQRVRRYLEARSPTARSGSGRHTRR
ncbi:MAG: hypothetical protein QGG14_01930 [Planctomycetota bacterium]|jgi:hypothetical protein|nr:hypothetical protein [Planctomycetota bacterium]